MGDILWDGGVIPSIFETQSIDDKLVLDTKLDGEVSLKTGYVCGIHYPGEPGHEKKRFITYDVMGTTSNGTPEARRKYKNCRIVNLFNSGNDTSSRVLRCPQSGLDPNSPEFIAQTTSVALLCVDGRSPNAVIIGVLEHPQGTVESKANGHNWQQSYNGVKASINKDGEYVLTFTGQTLDPTTNAFKTPSSAAGSFFKINKDGSVILNDNAGASIIIDKPNHNIAVTASGKTFIGSTASDEQLVLGNQLNEALTELMSFIDLWANSPTIPGVPIGVNALAQIIDWKAKWQTTLTTSPLLAQDKFTERETT